MVGSGTMATGIIEVFAKAGYEVVSVTRGAEKSAQVCEAVKTSLNKGVVRGKLTEADRDAALGRITWSADAGRTSPTSTWWSRPWSRS